jgi:hypothetical protein
MDQGTDTLWMARPVGSFVEVGRCQPLLRVICPVRESRSQHVNGNHRRFDGESRTAPSSLRARRLGKLCQLLR